MGQGNPNNGYPTTWQSGQGNPNNGYPAAWQNGHMDRCQYSNSAPFLAGPTPAEAYKDPNRDMKLIRKMGEMFQRMTDFRSLIDGRKSFFKEKKTGKKNQAYSISELVSQDLSFCVCLKEGRSLQVSADYLELNAWIPVMARPRMRAWMSWVPS